MSLPDKMWIHEDWPITLDVSEYYDKNLVEYRKVDHDKQADGLKKVVRALRDSKEEIRPCKTCGWIPMPTRVEHMGKISVGYHCPNNNCGKKSDDHLFKAALDKWNSEN